MVNISHTKLIYRILNYISLRKEYQDYTTSTLNVDRNFGGPEQSLPPTVDSGRWKGRFRRRWEGLNIVDY